MDYRQINEISKNILLRYYSTLSKPKVPPYSRQAIPGMKVQGGWGGWPTGNGKKLSSSQAQLGQATCLANAYFISTSGATSTPSALYSTPI